MSFLIAGLLYIDIGASVADSNDDLYIRKTSNYCIVNTCGEWSTFRKWENPLLFIEAGYKFKRTTIFIKHTSSSSQDDRGLNELGVRYRLFEWK